MKKTFLLSALSFSVLISSAQEITGDWYGLLKISGTQLRLTLNLVRNDTGYSGKLISVDQGNAVLPLAWSKVSEDQIQFRTALTNIEFQGKLKGGIIEGTFKQGPQQLPLSFGRSPIAKTTVKRPQEPALPYPYEAEDVLFFNKMDSIRLAGTLTLPKGGGRFPAVVLISGSGPQNRDEELAGHKPFLVLADHLTRNGIAVLRFDDRGVGKSEGLHSVATSADFAKDVHAAVAYLNTRTEIDQKKIGLIGHSEGGLIAPMVAAENSSVSFIVMMAGPGVNGREIIKLQSELIATANGANAADIKREVGLLDQIMVMVASVEDPRELDKQMTTVLSNAWNGMPDSVRSAIGTEAQFRLAYGRLQSPWMRYFLRYEPSSSLTKLTIPVLAINGEKDLQVWPAQNLPAIRKALEAAGNKKHKLVELPGLNHLFQECKTGAPSEYGEIEQTISPKALEEISSWIRKEQSL